MTDDIYRTQLRLPVTVYEQLRTAAEQAGRSLNAEIVHRLDLSLRAPRSSTMTDVPNERQKVELLLVFEEWLRSSKHSQDRKAASKEFCRLYNGADPDWEQVEPVHGVEEINPRFLRNLALAWHSYARESVYFHQFNDPMHPQRNAPENRKCELIITYLHWSKVQKKPPLDPASLVAFCAEYNDDEKTQLLDIPRISPSYLEELINTWFYKFPTRLAEVSEDKNFIFEALQAMHKQQQNELIALEVAMNRFAESASKKP
jgi:hypothetical protein